MIAAFVGGLLSGLRLDSWVGGLLVGIVSPVLLLIIGVAAMARRKAGRDNAGTGTEGEGQGLG